MSAYEITVIIIAITLIGFSMNLFYLMKSLKVGILWLILLASAEFCVERMHYEIKWYIFTIMPFYLFSVIYMMVKLRIRIDTALKRIDEREKQEAQEARMEKIRSGAAEMAEHYKSDPELKELNEFVGDYRDNDPV